MYNTIQAALDDELIPKHPDVDLGKVLGSDRNFTNDELIYIGENIAAFGNQLAKVARAEKTKSSGKYIYECITYYE